MKKMALFKLALVLVLLVQGPLSWANEDGASDSSSFDSGFESSAPAESDSYEADTSTSDSYDSSDSMSDSSDY